MTNINELIQVKFSNFKDSKVMIKAKELKKKLTEEEIDLIYQRFANILKISDKIDCVKQAIRFVMNGFTELSKCKVCGKELSLDYTLERRSYCSIKCRKVDKDTWTKKMKETSLKRYGAVSNLCTTEFKEKAKATYLKKYGVDNARKSKIVQNKIKETNLKRYGNVCALHGSNSEKIKNIFIEKYGVDSPAKLPKTLLKNKERIYTLIFNIITNNNIVTPLFTLDEALTLNSFKFKCNKCNNIFETEKLSIHAQRCFKCHPLHKPVIEQEIADFLLSLSVQIKRNDRQIIKPLELDIVIPEKKIAIEFNGDYWHSVQAGTDKNYHLIKTKMCEEAGYRLIHIFEHEWYFQQKLIKEKLKAILGVEQEKVYARKCIVKEIDVKEKNEFLNKYHIQGEDKSKIKLGLFYKDELIAVMTFGNSRFNTSIKYELIRYATSKHVIGGAGKLLTYFRKHYPGSIITYADRRFSTGNMYEKLGFKFLHDTHPNYWWVKDNLIYSRYKTMKSNLDKILGDKFDINKTEYENMTANGFYQLFDCGNKVYVI